MDPSSRLGLVLSGGGARGAYEAGVLAFLREGLAPDLRRAPLFDVVSGTSVGAIHTCFVAATAHAPQDQGERLLSLWRGLAAGDVFAGLEDLLPSLVKRVMRGARGCRRPTGPTVLDGLLTEGNAVERLVRDEIPWPRIAANLEAGHLSAVAVSATEILTGRTRVFVQQARDQSLPPWVRNTNVGASAAVLGPEHALASAAVPLLFESVELDGTRMCDGGLRQNTPLSPAVRLGATRLLVVQLGRSLAIPDGAARSPARLRAYTGVPYLVGKLMNAVFLDHVDNDLDRLRQVNSLLDLGTEAFGDDFLARINAAAARTRRAPYRRIDELTISPSRDLGMMASRCARSDAYAREARPLLMRLFELLLPAHDPRDDEEVEADLLSYLLFSPTYIQALMELGYEDARRRRDALERFVAVGGDPA